MNTGKTLFAQITPGRCAPPAGAIQIDVCERASG